MKWQLNNRRARNAAKIARQLGKAGAFAVNHGNLTELATSPFQLPAGAAPAGIVVT